MLIGRPPFRSADMGMLVQQIIRARIELPAGLSPESVGLIKALLQPDASQRLGAAPRGAAAVKEAPFFASVDWMQLFLRQVRIRMRARASARARARAHAVRMRVLVMVWR